MKRFCVEIQWRSIKKFLKGDNGAEFASVLGIAEMEVLCNKRVQEN